MPPVRPIASLTGFLLPLMLLSSPADAAPRTAPGVIGCTGPLSKNVSHARLVKAFGKRNVTIEAVGIGEGETQVASVIFPRDPARRIEVLWIDEKRRRKASEIRTGIDATWRTEHGIRRGMPLSEVEALNGRPFELWGFGFDYGGTTLDWKGGALATQSGGCTLVLRFAMRDGADNAAVYVGEQSLMSDQEGTRKADPVIDQVMLQFTQ